jgi:hypothetical protein
MSLDKNVFINVDEENTPKNSKNQELSGSKKLASSRKLESYSITSGHMGIERTVLVSRKDLIIKKYKEVGDVPSSIKGAVKTR